MSNKPDRVFTPKKGNFAISRLRQVDGSGYSDPLTAAALGISFDVSDDVLVQFMPMYEIMGNAGKLSGSMWPDAWYQGNLGPGELNMLFEQLKPHELLWSFGFWCSDIDDASQIGSGEGYAQKMRYQAENQTKQHYFTSCSRLGPEASGIMKLLSYGNQMDSLLLKIDRTANFVTLDAKAIALGKYKTNVFREKILGNLQDTSLTLSTKGVEGSSAQTRLDSIMDVKCDIEGDGLSSEHVSCTAASDATPAVLTIEPPNKKFRKVYTQIDGVYTDHGDGQTAFVIALGDTDDEWLIGTYKQVNHLIYTSSVANDEAQTMDIEYFATDGTWTSVADLVDGTETGGDTTLAQTGTIHFNMPTDWQRTRMGHSSLNNPAFSTAYWLKIKVTGALKATTAGTIAISTYEDVYKVDFDNNGTFEDDATTAARSATGSNFWNTITYTAGEDTIYIGCKNDYFRGIRWFIDDGTPNAEASALTASYYDGSSWTSLAVAHNFADGTAAPAGTPFAQSGDMTWDQITDGQPSTVNGTVAYWIKITCATTLTANVTFQAAMLINRNAEYTVFYRAFESVSFSEGDTFPDQITGEESFTPTAVTLLEGGTFDSTNEVIKNGSNLGCQINTIELALNRNNGAPNRCVDGTGDPFPKKPIETGAPTGTLTVVYQGDTPRWWLQHEHLNQGTLADTEDVKRFCMGLNLMIPIPIDGYATDDLYPMAEISLPYCCLKSAPIGNGDNEHICTVTYDIGFDSTNSYRPVYVNGISTDSSGYAQAS
jgi:hypothetical protein